MQQNCLEPKLQAALLTIGEPAGVGVDCAVIAFDLLRQGELNLGCPLIVLGDKQILIERASELNIDLPELTQLSEEQVFTEDLQTDYCYFVQISDYHPCKPGQLLLENGQFVLAQLECALRLCNQSLVLVNNKKIATIAMCTGPIYKYSLAKLIDGHFAGLTEYLAQACDLDVNQVLMCLFNNKAKVVLASTHMPLRNVPEYLTNRDLSALLASLPDLWREYFATDHPHIGVLGLNPHAGVDLDSEESEENKFIKPAIDSCNKLAKATFSGPLAADSVWIDVAKLNYDCIVGMYHDQVLPVIKSLDFAHTYNLTLGLPMLRISPDHGPALALAGSGKAQAQSTLGALQLLASLHSNRIQDAYR